MEPRTILLDLDGTLYAAGQAIPGAIEAVGQLRDAGLTLRFLTNTDSRTPGQVWAELRKYGLEIEAEELFTPVTAATQVLALIPRARALALVSAALAETFAPFDAGNAPYSHVIIGDCRDRLDYALLDGAFRAARQGAELLALQRGRYFKAADGDHLDTGAIVAALEYATGQSARVLGKPSPEFLVLAAASARAATNEVIVVGDDATTDIAMARSVGACAVQVRTGKFADQVRQGVALEADYLIDSIAELPDLLRRRLAN